METFYMDNFTDLDSRQFLVVVHALTLLARDIGVSVSAWV